MTASSHGLDVRFDAKGLVAHAGLILPATLARRLGLPKLLRQRVRLARWGARPTTTRTFYKPDPSIHSYPTNWDYWLAQPGSAPWTP